MADQDAFKAALANVAARAAEAAAAGSPESARTALAACIRELAAALERLPASAPAAPTPGPADDPVRKTGIDVTPPDKGPEPAPAASGARPEEEFFRRLAETHKLLAQGPWPFDPEDYAFLERAPEIYKAMSDADRSGERMTKTLVSAVDRVDTLVRHAQWVGPSGPLAKLLDLRQAAAVILGLRGASIGPEPARPEPPGHPAGQEIHRAALELAGFGKIPTERRGRVAASVKQLARYAEESTGADDDKRVVLVRFSLNEITPHEPFFGSEASKRLLALLGKSGLSEILVPIGQLFDDSYSPSKYDRRKVPSKEARNTILQVLQRGFLNREGVCIQKAVVAISSGE